MVRFFTLCMSVLMFASVSAQKSQGFKGRIYNSEYQVYMQINLYDKNVLAPGQEMFGELPGYLGSKRDARLWFITDAKVNSDGSADLTIINDYGSEDLTAKLVINADGTYSLKQVQGSAIKIAVDGKWVKLPKTLVFKFEKP